MIGKVREQIYSLHTYFSKAITPLLLSYLIILLFTEFTSLAFSQKVIPRDYENKSLGFKIQYPSNWNVQESNLGFVEIVYFFPMSSFSESNTAKQSQEFLILQHKSTT